MQLKGLIPGLLFTLSALAFSLPGQAAMVGTAQLQGAATVEPGNIRQQRDWITEQLLLGGVDKADANSRVASMTDREVAQIYQRIDESPAGGADILVIGLVVFLVLEVTGYIDVIPER